MASSLPSCYFFHSVYSLVICKDHHQAIPEAQLIQHLTKEHLFTPHLLDSGGVRDALKELRIRSIPDAFNQIQPEQPISIIEGLEVNKGLLCQDCGAVFTSEIKALRHVRQQHHVSLKKNQQSHIASCSIQSLLPGKYLFRVPGPEQPARGRSSHLTVPVPTGPSSSQASRAASAGPSQPSRVRSR